ncbi:MAG: FliH/SctL family protein [Myxococcota bacterium]|nr:FliH/SctL family protein [Myxococcota bacterium]
MSDFIPLCSPGGRAFSRAAFLPPEDLSTFQQEVEESLAEEPAESIGMEEPQELEEDLEDPELPAGPQMFTEEEVARMQTESYQLGVMEGRKEADLEVEKLKGHIEIVEELGESLQGLRRKMVADIHKDIGELVIHASRRVVGETLAVHPPALMKLVEDAIDRLPGDDEVSVTVRPEAEEMVKTLLATRRPFVVEVDEGLEGGCVVRSSVGEVQASLEAAFEGLSQAVADWVEDQR